MTNLIKFLKRHQLIAYFVLTYAFAWTLWILFQPLYLEGQRTVAPLKFGWIDAASLSDILVEWVLIVLVTGIFTWLFNRTKGSILVTALIHPAMNTTGTFLNASIGALILLVVFSVFIIVLDKMWSRLPVDSSALDLAGKHAA